MSDTNSKINRVVWMDIPMADLDRACKFYTAVLGVEVFQESFGDGHFGVPHHEQGNGGCLVVLPEDISGDQRLLVYFNTDGRICDAIAQLTEHGGTVQEEIHFIGPHGFRAIALDNEGNRIGLHSNPDA